MSDENLISRARRGDQAAWEALVREHQQPVFRLAYLLLGTADEAEDVAQETFVRAFRALDRFDIERPARLIFYFVHRRRDCSAVGWQGA